MLALGLWGTYVPRMADGEGGEPLDVLELEGNLSDAEKPPEVPAGVYEAEVQGVQKNTSGKGNAYYAVQLRIPPEVLPPNVAEHLDEGAIMYWNRQTVPRNAADRRSIFNLRKLVEAFGLDSNVSKIDPNEWMGCKCRVRVRMGTWQGEQRAEIASIEPFEQAAPARSSGKPAKPAARGRGR